MTLCPYTYFLHNCLVVHLKPLSPLPTLNDLHSSSSNLLDKSFNGKLSTTLSTFPTPVITTTPITFPFTLDKFESPPLDQIISLLKSTSSTSSIDPLPLPILKSSPLSLNSPTLILCLPPTTDPSLTSQSTLRSSNA